MVLVNGIDLNDGNMDMGKMKSVLDADVENIRNAKATVEKMIEEKMLGQWKQPDLLLQSKGAA